MTHYYAYLSCNNNNHVEYKWKGIEFVQLPKVESYGDFIVKKHS